MIPAPRPLPERLREIKALVDSIMATRRKVGFTTLDVDGYDPEWSTAIDDAWLRDLPILCDQHIPYLLSALTDLSARVEQLTRERDLAIAHDTQPYPTAEAYELVCKTRDSRAERAEARVAELEATLQRRDGQ